MPIAKAGGISTTTPHGPRDAGIPPTESGEAAGPEYDVHMKPILIKGASKSNDARKPK